MYENIGYSVRYQLYISLEFYFHGSIFNHGVTYKNKETISFI